MTLLYVCYFDFLIARGIKKKILIQVQEFKNQGIKTILVYKNGEQLVIDNMGQVETIDIGQGRTCKKMNSHIVEYIQERIDWLYVRYEALGNISKLISTYKKRGSKILLEIPTYPFKGEILGNIKKSVKIGKTFSAIKSLILFMEASFSVKETVKYIDYIVTYSKDKEIWGVPTIVVSNGVDFNINQMRDKKNLGKAINIISVANNEEWHGYDRFLKGLGNYYFKRDAREIIYHCVGAGSAIDGYKKVAKEYGIEEKVVFYGNLELEELNEVFNKADIALDAMGRHRVGVEFNSTIKGKEYMAKGLPIISGVETELDDVAEMSPYYMRVSANEEPIDIDNVVRFYESIYVAGDSVISVSTKIRNIAKEKFSFDKVMEPIIKKIM